MSNNVIVLKLHDDIGLPGLMKLLRHVQEYHDYIERINVQFDNEMS